MKVLREMRIEDKTRKLRLMVRCYECSLREVKFGRNLVTMKGTFEG